MAKKSEKNEVTEMEDKVVSAAKKIVKKVENAVESVAEDLNMEDSADKMLAVEKKSDKEDKKAKLASLLKKAKELEGSVEDVKQVDLKKKVKSEEDEKEDTLVPMEDYLKSSIHLGTRVITPDMRSYVYRRRADGLAVFNTAMLDDKIMEGAEFLAKYAPEDVIIVCKREAGWNAVRKFSETTGIKSFMKKYPAGILTNTSLDNFMETKLIFICDPWLDKNALADALRVKVPVLSICDTNNYTAGITKIIPANNKSAKSLGMVLYLLTKIYAEKRKLDVKVPPIQEFIEGWDELVAPAKN